MGWDYVYELLPLTDILFVPQMIWVWRAMVGWYWQGKTEELGEKPVPVPLCPPQISHGLTRARTRVSAVRGRRLTALSHDTAPFFLLWDWQYKYFSCHSAYPAASYILSDFTERRGRAVNTPSSYSGGPGFKSQPGGLLSWLTCFVVFFRPSRRMLRQ
jgi:hypothetical protein